MGMCGPQDPLFTPLLQFARVPFQARGSVHKTPFWENWEILASRGPTASIFIQISAHKPPNLEIFSSQAPEFGNFQFTSPPNLEIFSHKPPFQRQVSVRKSHTSKIRSAHPYQKKKSWVPPPPGVEYKVLWLFSMLFIFYCSQLKLFVSKILKHHVFSLPVQFLQQVKIHVFGNDIYLIEPWASFGGRQGDTSPSRFEGWGHNIKCPPHVFRTCMCVPPKSPISL